MTIGEMRKALREAYPGNAWKDKIINAKDDQIFAIYTRLLLAGKIGKK